MEPSVRYVTTSDGVAIAYTQFGAGNPIVFMPSTPFSHIQLEWGIPGLRHLYDSLVASGHSIVRYDARGTGLSERDAADLSLRGRLLDLEAVLDATDLDAPVLFATGDTGIEAMTWAANYPDRISHLILWCCWARRADVSSLSTTRSLRALLDEDWNVYTETVARVLVGWSNETEAKHLAEFYRQCTTPEIARATVPIVYEWDVTQLLSKISCPTLVAMPSELPYLSVDIGRSLASRIPDAQFAILEGDSPLPFSNDIRTVLSTITDFLGSTATPYPAVSSDSSPITILFTDIEGSTSLTQRIGDVEAQQVIHEHDRIVREGLRGHGGTQVKHTGDGIMASFISASRAVDCAISIQRALSAFAETNPESTLRVRIGLNSGEPIAEHGDYFGTAVQLAARVCAHAKPGQILVTNVVREMAAGRQFQFHDCGEVTLRGFNDPIRLFEVPC